jgi:hypothetical protein
MFLRSTSNYCEVKNERLPDFLDRVITPGRSMSEESGEAGELVLFGIDYTQRISLRGAVGYYELDNFRGPTESVYIGRFTAESRPNRRSVTYIPVEDIAELGEPGVYVAVMTQPGRFRYDSQTTYFYVSDLGMHLRLFDKAADVFVSSLIDGRAVRGVEISWIDANGKTLTRAETDSNGHATFAEWSREAKVAIARKDKVSRLRIR